MRRSEFRKLTDRLVPRASYKSGNERNETKQNGTENFFLECGVPLDLTKPSGGADCLRRAIRGV